MATITKRANGWSVQIRRKGYPQQTRTLPTKSEAQAWAREQEGRIDRALAPINLRLLKGTTLRDVIERYLDEVTPTKDSDYTEAARLKKILREQAFCDLALADLTPKVFTDYRTARLAKVPVFHGVRDLGSGLISPDVANSARDRILTYFRRYPMTLIEGDELLVVSGIGEWARRVRELRVEFGWWVCSGVTFKQMAADDPDTAAEISRELGVEATSIRPDQYALASADQDRDAAHRWNVLNTIRNRKGAVKDKILEYLRANVGHPVSGEELRYIAKNRKEWARRARELRTEDGWPVVTKMQGRPDLAVGSYLLEEDKRAPEHDRKIPDDVRITVLERDGFACTHCGWTRGALRPDDPRKLLELHHIIRHVDKGENLPENLVTLCNVHHDQIHAGRLTWADDHWIATQR